MKRKKSCLVFEEYEDVQEEDQYWQMKELGVCVSLLVVLHMIRDCEAIQHRSQNKAGQLYQ